MSAKEVKFAGVAVLERSVDPETGGDTDTLVAEFGAIPPTFPHGTSWSVALN